MTDDIDTALGVPDDVRKQVMNRLKRARGQLDAVIEAVSNESDCRKVVIQLAAVSSAVHRAGFVIVASGMKHCLATNPDGSQSDEAKTIEEMEKLFMMLS